MSTLTNVIGIDVAKYKIDVAFADHSATIANNQRAIEDELIHKIDPDSIVIMEATGGL
jgi:transposase